VNQEQSGIVQNRSQPVLEHWNKGQNTMKHNFAALYTCIVGASRVLGTVRNGQERFQTVPGSRGLCVLLACSDIFWLSSTKSPPAENMTGTRNKHDLQETEGQEDLHTNRNPCPVTAGKQVQRRQTFDMLWHDRVPPERISACIQHARCQRASCALLGSISEHLEHREWCEWPTEGKYFNMFGPSFVIFGRAMFMGCSAMGQGSWRQHMLSPGLSYYITDTATGQIYQYSFQIF